MRELAVELCRRLATFGDHLTHSGKGLERAVKAHNDAVGSFEGRILPTTRRMAELGVADAGAIDAPPRVETPLRPATEEGAAELPAAVPASQGVAVGHG